MSVDVAVSATGIRAPLPRQHVVEVVRSVARAERVRDALVSVTFVSARRIAELNRRHLGHSGSTDVISFAFKPARASEPLVADIYIAPAVARRNAERHGVPAREEIVRLVVHGVLHAVGYDHPEGMGRMTSAMWQRQEELLRRLHRGRASRSRAA